MSSTTSYIPANTIPDFDPRFGNALHDDPYGPVSGSNHPTNQQRSSVVAGGGGGGQGKKFRLALTQRLHWTAVLAFVSFLILLLSFASPYWLASYKFTDSTFKRLGLWDFCFQDYRHPSYQYDTKFTGCHWIYSPIYANIRDWLLPPWFMFVQAVMTIALCVSALGLLATSIVFMHFLIQYQLIILSATLLCHLLTTMLLFFALATFYFRAFDKSWIMYPDFNHVDWAFFFALVSMAGNGFASYLYYQEVANLKQRMLKMKRLIVATTPATLGGRSTAGGGDMDSLDAVYATRSVNLYNQSLAAAAAAAADGNNNNHDRTIATRAKDPNAIYPHFTQV